MTEKLNGCHNRNPFAEFYVLTNGQLQENFAHGAACQYTHTELGQADNGCKGCIWQVLKGEK